MKPNPDFKDLFKILNEENVKYLVVGAYAVIYYTEPRFTKDLDIWVEPTKTNAQKVWKALTRFGAPMANVTQNDFVDHDLVYQIGIEPNRIDIMMDVDGTSFDNAWKNRVTANYADENINVISLEHLILTKRATNRPQDQLDLTNLQTQKSLRK